MNIAVLGGTGPQGRGLAYRLALAGHHITVGSRDEGRAVSMALEIAERAGDSAAVNGATNAVAAKSAEIIVLAVPYAGHGELVASLADQLRGKIVVSCINPLAFDQHGPYAISVDAGSAAEEAAILLPETKIVGAFHHVSALSLWKTAEPLSHEDVLVCGDDEEANQLVSSLAEAVTGSPGVTVGPLRLARELEPWTAVLISVNKRYKVRSGIHISGL